MDRIPRRRPIRLWRRPNEQPVPESPLRREKEAGGAVLSRTLRQLTAVTLTRPLARCVNIKIETWLRGNRARS